MEYGAIDLHLRRSQFRIVREDGSVLKEGRIETTRAAFAQVWGNRPPMRVLIESSTDSEWVAQQLEALGHEVIIADPNYAAMYGSRSRKVKTDRRDAAALAEACRTGIYRRAHRVSAARRSERQRLRIRRRLVAMRSSSISLLRAVLRQEGYRVPRGSAETVDKRLERLELPHALGAILTPLRSWLRELNRLVADADQALRRAPRTMR